MRLERQEGGWVEAGQGSILEGLHPDELGNTRIVLSREKTL